MITIRHMEAKSLSFALFVHGRGAYISGTSVGAVTVGEMAWMRGAHKTRGWCFHFKKLARIDGGDLAACYYYIYAESL